MFLGEILRSTGNYNSNMKKFRVIYNIGPNMFRQRIIRGHSENEVKHFVEKNFGSVREIEEFNESQ